VIVFLDTPNLFSFPCFPFLFLVFLQLHLPTFLLIFFLFPQSCLIFKGLFCLSFFLKRESCIWFLDAFFFFWGHCFLCLHSLYHIIWEGGHLICFVFQTRNFSKEIKNLICMFWAHKWDLAEIHCLVTWLGCFVVKPPLLLILDSFPLVKFPMQDSFKLLCQSEGLVAGGGGRGQTLSWKESWEGGLVYVIQ
jgi:hypothetical protein